MTSAVAPEVLSALGRLNSHARAFGCGKQAIYAYKATAINILAEAKQVSGRLVEWRGKCNRCDGTGRFAFDWEDYRDGKTVRCRNCGGSGRVTLQFLETTLPDGQVWHHPWNVNRIGFVGWGLARAIFGSCEWQSGPGYGNYFTLEITNEGPVKRALPWHSVEGWSPNSPGAKLIGEPAAELLNVVEAWIEVAPLELYARRRVDAEMRSYSLDIGRTSSACHYCGNAGATSLQGHVKGFLHWSTPVCEAHQGLPVAQWDNELPQDALTPAIEVWLARRGWKSGGPLPTRWQNHEARAAW